jgi:VIT1/CCC1 family predicted Fe2+/Mn2+ transporter
MTTAADTSRFLENLADERNSAHLYTVVAETVKKPQLAEFYRRLAASEQHHAHFWAEQLRAAGAQVPAFKPEWRTRALVWLARRFGPEVVLPTMIAREQDGSAGYRGQPEAKGMVATEDSHARLLRQMGETTRDGLAGGALAQIEGRHRTAGGNALRAAVLGASDGLLSNFSLIMGVAGADLSSGHIVLTGLAGLLAGAISMALGEWISVQSSRELYAKQLRTEKEEIASAPEEETEELTLIYQARGLPEASARQLAAQIMSDHDTAIQALAREELSIDPEELGGSAWEAAFTSFALFAAGAVVPLLPFLFLHGLTAVFVSALVSALGLFLIGAAITLFTGRSVLSSGLRQVIFGLAAAAATYLIGKAIGISLGG